MEKYRDAFPNENIHIHIPTDGDPANGYRQPCKPRYKYVYIWRALTPTGRVSKYYHAELSNKWRETNYYSLPKLRKGYQWFGPYLYAESETY